MNKCIFAILILAFIIFSNIFLNGCEKKKEDVSVNIDDLEFPDQEGWNEIITSSKNGTTSAIIKYGHMQHFQKKKIVEFDDGIIIDFYNDQGVHTSKLTSNKGRLNEGTNDIEAFGNVVVVSDTGITLQTERLFWDNKIEKIVSNDYVTIVTADNDSIYGHGFESDQYLNNWSISELSGKMNRGLDLNIKLDQSKSRKDSSSIDSLTNIENQISDTTKIVK